MPRIATQVIGARSATAAEARILDEKRGASLLTMTRTAWDASGRALEYGSHLYRASRYCFELNLSARLTQGRGCRTAGRTRPYRTLTFGPSVAAMTRPTGGVPPSSPG